MEEKSPEITGHPLHPSCTLVLNGDGAAFNCAACKRGSSHAWRYSCASCRFDLHEECATSPATFDFWGHPHHPLTLVNAGPDLAAAIRSTKPEAAEALVASSKKKDGVIPVYCNICTNEVEGMHYQCAPCGVFLHPVCVQLPVTLRSNAHPAHDLTLMCTFPTMCRQCFTPGTWAYRCFRCLLLPGFHANCLPEVRHLLGSPYSADGGVPDPRRQFGIILGPEPPPMPRMFGIFNPPNPWTMPRRGPDTTTPSVDPDPWGGAFPYGGEYGRSTFGQAPPAPP